MTPLSLHQEINTYLKRDSKQALLNIFYATNALNNL